MPDDTPGLPPYISEAVLELLQAGKKRGGGTITALFRQHRRAGVWPSEAEVDRLVVGAAFMCPACGAISHNHHDVVERYCGRCRVFADDVVFGP